MRPSTKKQYVICVKNKGYEASLEQRKIYLVKPDKLAAERGFIRIVDESQQSYLYPIDYFVALKLPQTIAKALAA